MMKLNLKQGSRKNDYRKGEKYCENLQHHVVWFPFMGGKIEGLRVNDGKTKVIGYTFHRIYPDIKFYRILDNTRKTDSARFWIVLDNVSLGRVYQVRLMSLTH